MDELDRIPTTESLNILAASFYLRLCIAQDFKTLWTPKRVQTIIDPAVKHRVAIEIIDSYHVPDTFLLKSAKSAGKVRQPTSRVSSGVIKNIANRN